MQKNIIKAKTHLGSRRRNKIDIQQQPYMSTVKMHFYLELENKRIVPHLTPYFCCCNKYKKERRTSYFHIPLFLVVQYLP